MCGMAGEGRGEKGVGIGDRYRIKKKGGVGAKEGMGIESGRKREWESKRKFGEGVGGLGGGGLVQVYSI